MPRAPKYKFEKRPIMPSPIIPEKSPINIFVICTCIPIFINGYEESWSNQLGEAVIGLKNLWTKKKAVMKRTLILAFKET